MKKTRPTTKKLMVRSLTAVAGVLLAGAFISKAADTVDAYTRKKPVVQNGKMDGTEHKKVDADLVEPLPATTTRITNTFLPPGKRKFAKVEGTVANKSHYVAIPEYVDVLDKDALKVLAKPEGPLSIKVRSDFPKPLSASTYPLKCEGNFERKSGGGGGGGTPPPPKEHDIWRAHVATILDADVDSDNDNGFDPPKRSIDEDKIEDKENLPGKYVAVNDADLDEDLVPGYADGFNLKKDDKNDDKLGKTSFAQLVLALPSNVDLSKAELTVKYDASNPLGVKRDGNNKPDDPYIYTLPKTGSLRLWLKPAAEARNGATANEDVKEKRGDYVAPGVYKKLTNLGFSTTKLVITAYIEGVKPSAKIGAGRFEFLLDPGNGKIKKDAVRVTVVGLDLDIDSDSTNGLNELTDADGRTVKEDHIEMMKKIPGKNLAINKLDLDKDAVPDFADGYDIKHGTTSESGVGKSHDFTPLVLEVPAPIDLKKATVRLKYSASDPDKVKRSGDGSKGNPYKYSIPNQKIRIWTKNGSVARKKASVVKDGDFVPANVDIPLAKLGGKRIVRLYVEGLKGSGKLADVEIKAEVDPDGAGKAEYLPSDLVKATVFYVQVVHPIASDFTRKKDGRILISTEMDDSYHTTKKTTAANKVAQTKDAEVVISAYVLPQWPKIDVFFEAIDPDDLSHYEGKTVPGTPRVQGDEKPNDNVDADKTMKGGTPAKYATYQAKCLSVRSAKTALKQIDGKKRSVAETTLKITNRHSGDNYKVRAVCRDAKSKEFDTISGTTAGAKKVEDIIEGSRNLVAWKRIYIELDSMYKKGATVTAKLDQDGDEDDDEITVDNSSDFAATKRIVIFGKDGDIKSTTVKSVSAGKIKVADLKVDIPRYAGIRLVGSNDTYQNKQSLNTAAYGDDPDGKDGGTFVEFQTIAGGGNVGKYSQFPDMDTNAGKAEVQRYCGYWFKNTGKKNCIQFVAGKTEKNHATSFGVSFSATNIVVLTIDAFSTFAAAKRDKAIAETSAHEIGHHFNLKKNDYGHVDREVETKSHDDKDMCLMSYKRKRDDGVAEFDFKCLKHIRKEADGL